MMPSSSDASAQTWTPITPSSTKFAAQSPPMFFRALRFDLGGVAGPLPFTFTNQAGTSLTRYVMPGDVWMATQNAIVAITAASGVTIDGLG
jgi:hypothetical protein